ncbi:MAG: Fe-S cluster assembly protein SufD [Rhizomicrobium sp.]|jgi:Fe-S cluster assembly protein SufD
MNAPLSPLEVFRSKGVPGRRIEEWKYTDLRSIADIEAIGEPGDVCTSIKVPDDIEYFSLGDVELSARASRAFPDAGVMVQAARAGTNHRAFAVPSGAHVETPLCLEFARSGHADIVILLGRESSLRLVEEHESEGTKFRNIALTILLEEGARFSHFRTAKFAGHQIGSETISVHQAKRSVYRGFFQNGGAKVARAELNIVLAGEGAEADVAGVSVLGGTAHADITTRIDHAAPNTISRQLFKNIAGGSSRAIYQGKIVVHEGAIGSDSRQTAKALLMSSRAEADLKPELEIFADDVKCAHGAAVGDLDAESLFYLRSRGIPEADARTLLVKAFLGEAVDTIENETLRAAAWRFVEDGLVGAMKASP